MKSAPEHGVRVRFAPSPTGLLTLGNVRTGLFAWLFARKNSGVFVLRIEDTDPERSKQEYEKKLIEDLHWLGIDWEEGVDWINKEEGRVSIERGKYGPYRQTERSDIYKSLLEKLLEEGKAYHCYCTPEELEAQKQSLAAAGLPQKYNGHCRSITSPPAGRTTSVIRLKITPGIIQFQDIIRGNVSFDPELFGDFIIARNVTSALYNFAVTVDDALMHISHVIRGEEHISNTPKQILIQRSLGYPAVEYAHAPLILGADRAKLSKRTGSTPVSEYRAMGYLPEALVNFLALLGWHPSGNQEVFTVSELIREFELKRVQKAGAIFNAEKLEWMNAQHIKRKNIEELVPLVQNLLQEKNISASTDFVKKILELEHNRITTLSDIVQKSGFFFALPEYEPDLLIWKESNRQNATRTLEELLKLFDAMNTAAFIPEHIKESVQPLIDRTSRGEVLWPLRVALSGQKASPDPIEIMDILGKEGSVERIKIAIAKLS